MVRGGGPSSYAVRLVGVGVAYYVSARLGLQLAVIGKSVTPLWPPTGLAVVALLGFGYGMWPAVAVAAFAVNLPISPTASAAALIAVGNTLAPIAAVALLRRGGFRRDLVRLRDALLLMGVALTSMTISASIGTASLVLSDAVSSSRASVTWWTWWTGDAMGVLLVAPFLWSLWPLRKRMPEWSRLAEASGLYVLLGVATFLVCQVTNPIFFVVLPGLVWVAWRFQPDR